ncbi:MAG: HAMP domain-containing sensor histidine kinase, partial [Chloroflexota bacterium]
QAQRVVARASVAIENARLYAAVQAADRAKSEFVGTVAHDLKVPMTSIMGYADLILLLEQEHENLVDRQGEFLGKISDTVERMKVMVSDLSDISRVETGYFFMDPIKLSVDKIVEGVKDNTMTQIAARSHTFIEDVEPGLPDMWVDYYRLLQVLTNLVSNAYKYTPDGGTITLSVKRSGNRVRFSVSDTGIGLTEEQIAKLGTKFWRADDDYTRSQQGTGLGFSITSSRVELMGSYIKIESVPGLGSAFSFSIAIATGDGDPNATQALDMIPGYEDFRP